MYSYCGEAVQGLNKTGKKCEIKKVEPKYHRKP